MLNKYCSSLQIKEANPLVSEKLDLAILNEEYRDDPVYTQKVKVSEPVALKNKSLLAIFPLYKNKWTQKNVSIFHPNHPCANCILRACRAPDLV